MATGSLRLRVVVLAALLASTCVLTTPASAAEPAAVSFTVIERPGARYVSDTCLFDIAGIPEGDPIRRITGDCGRAEFNDLMRRFTEHPYWSSWGAPPFTESATPPILVRASGSGDIKMSLPKSLTVGVEVQPVTSAPPQMIRVLFINEDDDVIATITREVDTARLFAVRVRNTRITKVIIYVDTEPADPIAIAQLRAG